MRGRPPTTMINILQRVAGGDTQWVPSNRERWSVLELVKRGYLEREWEWVANPNNRNRGTRSAPRFTITPAGYEWLKMIAVHGSHSPGHNSLNATVAISTISCCS